MLREKENPVWGKGDDGNVRVVWGYRLNSDRKASPSREGAADMRE